MLSDRARNLIVGLTILISLGVCMYGLFLLGKMPLGSLHQYKVTLIAPDANGVTAGSRVEFNGVGAGTVDAVYPATQPDQQIVVKVQLSIDSNIQIPAAAKATLTRPQAVGNAYVAIKANTAKPPMLPQDGTATLPAEAPESSLIPKEVFSDIHDLKADLAALAHEITTVARDLHKLLDYTPPEAIANADPTNPNRPVANLSTVVIRLNTLVENLQTWLNDPKLQGNVRDAVQNFTDASAQLKSILAKVDTTVANANSAISGFSTAASSINGAATQASATLVSADKEIFRVTQQLVETLEQLQKSTKQLTEGPGTLGKLTNDPRLYEGLVDLSNQLKKTVSDLDFLVKKWTDEGVNMHLK